jgi:hypothetical protein
MMQATGLSLRYCSLIRRGYVPHPMHWESLRAACALATEAGAHLVTVERVLPAVGGVHGAV